MGSSSSQVSTAPDGLCDSSPWRLSMMPISVVTRRLCKFMADTWCVCHGRWTRFLRGSLDWTTYAAASVWRIVDR